MAVRAASAIEISFEFLFHLHVGKCSNPIGVTRAATSACSKTCVIIMTIVPDRNRIFPVDQTLILHSSIVLDIHSTH